MFPFGIFPFNILPTANPWWPIQAIQTRDAMQNATPPYMKAYLDAYAAWVSMLTKSNPFLGNMMQPPENK